MAKEYAKTAAELGDDTPKDGQIPIEQKGVFMRMERLRDAIANLKLSLLPVLHDAEPIPPNQEVKAAPPLPLAPLADAIRTINEELESAIDDLKGIIQRLEL